MPEALEPVPRSSLFVPAHLTGRHRSAADSGADAVVLDLEDSVPIELKAAGRSGVHSAVASIGAELPLIVRVNSEPDLLREDLITCAEADIPDVLLPKVSGVDDVLSARRVLREIGYEPRLAVLIESCAGVIIAAAILDAGAPIRSVALGVEDLRGELELYAPQRADDSWSLLWAHGALVVTAIGSGVVPLGILGSLGEFHDLDLVMAGARGAWLMGYRGSYCIHPRQVPVLNAAYSPSAADLAWADEVAASARREQQSGRGAFGLGGQMIDAAHVRRAKAIRELRRPEDGRPADS